MLGFKTAWPTLHAWLTSGMSGAHNKLNLDVLGQLALRYLVDDDVAWNKKETIDSIRPKSLLVEVEQALFNSLSNRTMLYLDEFDECIEIVRKTLNEQGTYDIPRSRKTLTGIMIADFVYLVEKSVDEMTDGEHAIYLSGKLSVLTSLTDALMKGGLYELLFNGKQD